MIAKPIKIILLPGTPFGRLHTGWFDEVARNFEELGYLVQVPNLPDRFLGREKYWLPFLTDNYDLSEQTILIGHSTGAVAAMRLAETHSLLGLVLVAAYTNDLGRPIERWSGYFTRSWDWSTIQVQTKWILQFASTNDPYVPLAEAHRIRDALTTDYIEIDGEGHFGWWRQPKHSFPELVDGLRQKLDKSGSAKLSHRSASR